MSEQTPKIVGSRTERGISEFKSHKSLDPDIERQSKAGEEQKLEERNETKEEREKGGREPRK